MYIYVLSNYFILDTSKHSISYHIISHHVISYHITSYHVKYHENIFQIQGSLWLWLSLGSFYITLYILSYTAGRQIRMHFSDFQKNLYIKNGPVISGRMRA